mmetsp:Transcript_1541/g.3935  ORF Transcript_1541/g.3935 Transcript_1541/m.3935 type:complete len:269 (-) Transcript_1541:238-1044(-)
MEDDDNYQPDATGHLELRYRGWTDIEPRIWSFADCLVHLDLSFNQLQTLPAQISNLHLLKELNCACNKLQSLPESIASLAWLRVIKANGNSIVALPKELGACKALELLNLSENVLTSIPQEIAGCTSLQTLLLQNNDLPRLPLSLATLSGKMQQLDISNNSQEMATIMPTEIHRDVHSIMWILGLQQEKRQCLDRLRQDVKLLQHDNIATEQELAQAEERIASLTERKRVLENDMESIRYFLAARLYYRELRKRMLHWWQECKRAWAR